MKFCDHPPLDLFRRGSRSKKFFDDDGIYVYSCFQLSFILTTFLGKWKADIPIPQVVSLDRSEENFKGKRKEEFLGFAKGMLQ